MSKELDNLLENMQRFCLAKAARMPSPDDPAPQAWEDAADDYVRMAVMDLRIEDLSPEAAAAMIPRIECAFAAGSPIEASYTQASSFGDAVATPERMLEELLINNWHKSLKPRWLDGRIVLKKSS